MKLIDSAASFENAGTYTYLLTSTRPHDLDALLPLVRHRRRARVRLDDREELDCELALCDAQKIQVRFEHATQPKRPVALLVDGYNARHIIALETPQEDPALTTSLVLRPARSLVFNRREARRTRAPLCWRLLLPLFDNPTSCRVIDVSFGGLAVLVPKQHMRGQQWQMGASFSAMLEIDDDIRGKLSLRIVHFEKDKQMLGLQLCGWQSSSNLCWGRRVGALLQPSVTCVEDADKVWRLLDESGFFQLGGKSREDFLPQRRAFDRFVEHSGDLSHSFVWSEENVPIATSTNTRAFDHAIVAHQLAVSPLRKSGRLVLRELLTHLIESIKYDRGICYFAAFLSASAKIHQVVFIDFAARHQASGLSLLRPFRLVEVQCQAVPPEQTPPNESSVFVPTQQMYADVFARRPEWAEALFWETFDLTPARIMGVCVHERWRKQHVFRARSLLAYRDAAGKIVAFLAMDVAEPGASLFGLFDQAYFLPVNLQTSARVRGQALRALLLMAREFYRQHRRTQFAFVGFSDLVPEKFYEDNADFLQPLARGSLVIFHRRLWGTLQEYWHRLFAPPRQGSDDATADAQQLHVYKNSIKR